MESQCVSAKGQHRIQTTTTSPVSMFSIKNYEFSESEHWIQVKFRQWKQMLLSTKYEPGGSSVLQEFTPSSCSVLPKQTKQVEECNLIRPNLGISHTSQIKLGNGKYLHKNKVILVWPFCRLLFISVEYRRLRPFVCNKIHLQLWSFVAFLCNQEYDETWHNKFLMAETWNNHFLLISKENCLTFLIYYLIPTANYFYS